MRIAIVAPPWLPVPPPAYGGTESVLDGLARGLGAGGHEVLLFTTGDSTCPVERRFTRHVSYGIDDANPVVELRHVIDAYDAIASWRPDLIHDHTLAGPVYASAAITTPVVTTAHGPFDSRLGPLYRTLSDRVGVIAISHHQASHAPAGRISTVIHHGVDVDRFVAGAGDGGYALFLGRMSPAKGVDRAIAIARRAGVPLKIAAKMREPAEKAYFQAVVEPLLGGDVEYLGEAASTEKVELLRRAVCLLNPIEWPEPFGMVMVEALACGTPVVATTCGSVPEIVDDGVTGYVRTSPREMAEALRDAASLSRSACRAAAVSRFSIERMTADHVAFYGRAIAGEIGATRAPITS